MRFCSPDYKPDTVLTKKPLFYRIAILGVTLAVIDAPAAMAAEQICVPDLLSLPAPGPAPEKPGDPIPIELEGDEVESVKEDIVSMRGNATLKRGRQTMSADQIRYHRQTDEVEGEGNVILHSQHGDRLSASNIKLQVETFIGEAEEAEYRFAKRDRVPKEPDKAFVNARGSAEKIFFEGHDVMRLENVRYTTCVEGKDDVFLTASDMTLDQAIGQGSAKHLKVRFKNVPIFYFPSVTFPINDERKSGFLYPSFGSLKGSGFVMQTPYYWNIAPNYDATIYPRIYSKRGVQLGGEFRYLTPGVEGSLFGEYLPSDSEFNDKDRGAYTIRHQQKFSQRWRANVGVQWVSDDQYLDDFSNDIQTSSAFFLPQFAEVFYTGRLWDFEGRLYAFQTVDATISEPAEPYDRLPQFRVISKLPRGPYGMRYGLESELVNFQKDVSLDGWRWDITPFVRLPLDKNWGYLTPKLSLRHTSYSLNNVAEGEDDRPSRSVPVFSLDSGVFFERITAWRGTSMLHTLEPRAFYVYIPKENQDDLPIFDTGFINLNNFGNIFSENRFFGRDRVGDTNHVTLALTSRYMEAESGAEWIRGSIGQIFFLADRVENFTPGQEFTNDTSDFLAEVIARLSTNWIAYGYLQYDDDESQVREGKFDLRFRSQPRKYINLSYRFSRNLLEQVDLSAEFPLGTPRWHALFTERYSIRDEENLETKVGIEYDACCWKLRGFFQSRKDNFSEERNAFIVQLELTGLTTISSGL
jgi:LPS-assembly protein